MTDLILHTPKKHERGHKQQRPPAGPQHAKHFAEARNIIVEMLDDIKAGYQIKLSVFVRQTLGGPLPDSAQSARATEVEGFGRNVNSFGNAKLCEHLKICARAAAHVEYARVSLADFAADAFNPTGDDPAATDEPPVPVLYLPHDRVGVRLHLARQGIGDTVCGRGHYRVCGSAA